MGNHPRRVLLVEDDRFLRKAAAAMLRRQGFTVLTAENGEEALRVAAEIPDLILLDLIMPKIQGFEVLKALKRDPKTSSIPVVILSNLGQESDSNAAREMGAVDYWVKSNLDLEEIVRRVEEHLAGGVA
jgi:CheY-like chemotaxis protein